MPDFMKHMDLGVINMKAHAHAIVDMVVAMLKRTIILEEQTLMHCL
jgi:hypothetical protein